MSANADYKFVLERIGHAQKIVLTPQERNYCCGRCKESKIYCPSLAVSRKHCTFFCTNNELFVMDLQSSNGLYINGQTQQPYVMIKLNDNDMIGIGCSSIDDNISELKEEDRFVFKLHIIIENVEPKDESHNSSSKETKSSETISVDNSEEQPPIRKRVQPINQYEVPKKMAKITSVTSTKTDETSFKKVQSNNREDENEIEIIHVSLSHDKSEQSSTNSNNTLLQSSNSDATHALEEITPQATKRLSLTSQHKKEDPKDSVMKYETKIDIANGVKPGKEQRVSLDEITSKQNNTIMLNNSLKKQAPINKDNKGSNRNTEIKSNKETKSSKESKTNKKVNKKTSKKVQSNETKHSNNEQIMAQAKQTEKSLQSKIEKPRNSIIPETSNNIQLPENIIQCGISLIKYEDELQITDTEEDINIALASGEIVAPSPLKIKQLKQEPKTRFSEVDVVNITDDEDDVFPCSQLFDDGFGVSINEDVSIKEEIKQEPDNIENNRFERVDNTDMVVSLSDSEDEENPWLEKLSRSQTEETVLESSLIKEEEINLDFDVADNAVEYMETLDDPKSRLSFIAQNLPDENELYKPAIERQDNMASSAVDINDVSSSGDASALKVECENMLDMQSKTIKLKDDAVSSSSNIIDQYDNAVSSSTNIMNEQHDNNLEPMSDETAQLQGKQKLIKKKIPEIDPLPLPVRRKQSIDAAKTKEVTAKSIAQKLSGKEKKELKLKEKKDEYMYKKKQKHRKELYKWADCLPASGKKKKLNLSEEEKRTLSDNRKAKLKELAIEEKRLSLENKPETKRVGTKPKAKVTLKNRGDLLLNDQLNLDSSKTSLNESSEKPSTSKSQVQDPCTSKSLSSNAKPVTKTKDQATSSEVINNVSNSFETYLKVCEVPNNIKIPKKSENNLKTKKAVNITEKAKKSLSISAEKPVKENTISPTDKPSKPSKSTLTCNGVLKKRVRFAEQIQTIREFEIAPENTMRRFSGKDAPIPREKLSKKISCMNSNAKVEEFLMRIFSWKPVWLEEQRQLNIIAPAVPEHELLPMLTHYKTYNDYYKIVSTLLLLEIWCGITKEFDTIDSNLKRPTVMYSIVENSITRPSHTSNSCLSSLLLEVVITKEGASKQAHPIYGDLVFFEYARSRGRCHEFHKVFAYVTNVYQTVLTQHTHYNKDLGKHVQEPYMLLTYTVLTRPLENDICVNRVQRLRTVTYLRATMRLVQALQYLPQSPLMKSILQPDIRMYQMPIILNAHGQQLVTKDELNTKQLEAVFKVTDTVIQKQPKLCFIQGPPGTGKSTVIVNIITQILYGDDRYKNRGSLRILLCAPSNAAIDEIVLRLLNIRASLKERRFKMVRIGRPESMHPIVKDISLTELAKRDVKRVAATYASNQIPNDSVEEEKSFLLAKINALKCEIANCSNMDEAYKKNITMKLTDMNTKYELLKHRSPLDAINPREYAKLQRAAENRVLEFADIITCTLSSCYTHQMESIFGGSRARISVCIVDEATQSGEAETLIPLMLGVNTLVLVGDTNQLPATVISQRAKKLGLDQSIFARVQNAFDGLQNNPIILLDTQYRMAPSISYWPNKFFYGGKLKNGVQYSTVFPFQQYRILNLNASQNDNKFSNTDEATFVANLIQCMLSHSSLEKRETQLTFGVVTPYQVQRSLILEKLNERNPSLSDSVRRKIKIDVNTVDAFQGQECDVIIMSCVRSNGIGFLSDRQRLCVALTRAKHCLVLCGNFNTFMRDPMWNALLSDGKSRGVYCNVNVRIQPDDLKLFIIKP